MRAAVYRRRGELEIVDVAVPELGPGEALVAVSHCGICGTDLHNVLDGWGQPDSVGGHEWSGTVAAIEDDSLPVGAGVVGGPPEMCGSCSPCREGRPSLCTGRRSPGVDRFQGAFAEYVVVPAARLIPVGPGASLRDAAYTEPLAVALHALDLDQVPPEARVMVFGMGPIGAAITAVLLARGQGHLVAVEPAVGRRRLAERIGVSRVVDPAELADEPMPNDIVADPVDIVFECSGHRAAIESGLGQLDRTGRLVLVGTGMDFPRLDINRVLLNELVVTGAYAAGPADFAAALALIEGGSLPLDVLIEPRDVGLADLLTTATRLRNGEVPGKVLVSP